MLIDILSFSCPLLLCSFAALFTEYAGSLALFLEGLVTFSAFVFYSLFAAFNQTGGTTLDATMDQFTTGTTLSASIPAALLTILLITLIIFAFSYLIEKFRAHKFIAGTALNLFFTSMTSFLSVMLFKTRGVLTNPSYRFDVNTTKILTIIITGLIVVLSILFLSKTRIGLYLRITGTDSDVLTAKGVNPKVERILSWTLAGTFCSLAGIFLTLRISSFVPGISSGRGWMALAAIFLGRKKPLIMLTAVVIFCAADYFGVHIQNIFPGIPSSILLSLPYVVALLLTMIGKREKSLPRLI